MGVGGGETSDIPGLPSGTVAVRIVGNNALVHVTVCTSVGKQLHRLSGWTSGGSVDVCEP